MTQKEKVLAALRTGQPVCGTYWLNHHIPRYAARIYELRTEGYVIGSRRCDNLHHMHDTPQVEYFMERQAEVLPLFP